MRDGYIGEQPFVQLSQRAALPASSGAPAGQPDSADGELGHKQQQTVGAILAARVTAIQIEMVPAEHVDLRMPLLALYSNNLVLPLMAFQA
jgi:hypothetical protein